MNIIKRIISIILIIISIDMYGQQEPLYSQYYNSFNIINPGYAGAHDFFTFTTSVRRQSTGEPDSPQTGVLSVHGNVGKNLGIGFSIAYDKVSVLNDTGLYADFSYTISTSEKSRLAFGIKGGGNFINVNLTKLGLKTDPLFNQNINTFIPNLGAGFFFYTDKFYVSYSALNLLNENYYDKKNGVIASASDNVLMYLSSGYNFKINKHFNLKPSFLMRYTKGVPFSTDVSLAVLWLDKVELGVSHRLDDSFAGLFQIRANNNIKIGYTYESYITNLSRYNNGSHEISIIFDIGKSTKTENAKKPPFYW